MKTLKIITSIFVFTQFLHVSACIAGGCSVYLSSNKGGLCTALDPGSHYTDTVYTSLNVTDTIVLCYDFLGTGCGFGLQPINWLKNGIVDSNSPSTNSNCMFSHKFLTTGYGSYSCIISIDTLTIIFMQPTTIENIDNTYDIKIFPNPTTGIFEITGVINENSFQLFDITGKLVHEVMINSDKQSFDLTYLDKGMYFFIIRNRDKKILKQEKIILY